jgi:ABC-type cobalt transport system substrate-binding protein
MSRKLILSLAAIATLASATLVSASADAMESHGGRGGAHIIHPIHPIHPHYWPHFRPIVVRRSVEVLPVAALSVAEPGPCTCLTKGYTPEGLVVFKDECTKEMASAPVDGSPAQAKN